MDVVDITVQEDTSSLGNLGGFLDEGHPDVTFAHCKPQGPPGR